MNITIRVKNKTRAEKLIEFLKELPYVEMGEKKKQVKKRNDFKQLFGLWKDRDISLEKIRDSAWKR